VSNEVVEGIGKRATLEGQRPTKAAIVKPDGDWSRSRVVIPVLNWKSRAVGAAMEGVQWKWSRGLESGRC
jgi:hypothetical protein